MFVALKRSDNTQQSIQLFLMKGKSKLNLQRLCWSVNKHTSNKTQSKLTSATTSSSSTLGSSSSLCSLALRSGCLCSSLALASTLCTFLQYHFHASQVRAGTSLGLQLLVPSLYQLGQFLVILGIHLTEQSSIYT